jgi:hypothetical protein
MRTVARSKLHLIVDLDLDVRLRLKTLQDHFRITNQQQILELSSQYAAIQQKRDQNIDTWLNEYSRITSLCRSEDMAEMKGTRPQWAFIQAVEAQGDADWSNQHFTLMIGCEEDEKTPPTLEALINRYRRWIATKRTHTKTLGSFAAKDSTQATLAITDARPNNRSKCVCGRHYNALECYTLNRTAEGRPEGYQPSQTTIRMIRTAFKDRELLKKIKKLYKDNNVRWTFDTAENSDQSESRSEHRSENRAENRAESPTSESGGRRSYADQIDDNDLNEEYYANTAFLISYDASNIYQEKLLTPPVEPRIIKTVYIPEEENDGDTTSVAQPVRQRQEAATTPVSSPTHVHVSEKEYDGDTVTESQRHVRQLLSPSPTPTFEGQDQSPSPNLVEQQLLQESSALMDSPHRTPGGWNDYENDNDAKIYIPDRQQNSAPQRRDLNLSQDNIVTGRRRRQAHFIEASPSTEHHAFVAIMQQSYKATSLASQPRIKRDPTRIQRYNLPPPRNWKKLKRYAHRRAI